MSTNQTNLSPVRTRITLDVTKSVSQASVAVVQGSTTRRLIFTLTENGGPYPLPAGSHALVAGEKTWDDGTVTSICEYCVIYFESNTVVCDLSSGATGTAGDYELQLSILDKDGEALVAPWFTLIVRENRFPASLPQSTAFDEFRTLVSIFGQDALDITTAADLTLAGAEEAKSGAEAAKSGAEAARSEAEAARSEAEAAAVDARFQAGTAGEACKVATNKASEAEQYANAASMRAAEAATSANLAAGYSQSASENFQKTAQSVEAAEVSRLNAEAAANRAENVRLAFKKITESNLHSSRHVPVNTLLEVTSLSANCLFVIAPPSEDIEGADNKWDLMVTQGETAYDVDVLARGEGPEIREIRWVRGYAPSFPANSITICRMYRLTNGDVGGEWVTFPT